MKRYTVTLTEDDNGDLILPIPDELCEDLGWNIGDQIEYSDEGDGTLLLFRVDE
jgi:bifunctional DNA-binding transcriptional regulator/antitoxin component of YhaV-PrlF toxin-antitoxin module